MGRQENLARLKRRGPCTITFLYKNEQARGDLQPPFFKAIFSVNNASTQGPHRQQIFSITVSMPKMRHLSTYMLLTLFTISTFTLALPSPPNSLTITTPQGLRSEAHCGAVACPGSGPDGDAFCERLGCDYCVIVVSSPPTTRYECDGVRGATHGVSLVTGGKPNEHIAPAVRQPNRVKHDAS